MNSFVSYRRFGYLGRLQRGDEMNRYGSAGVRRPRSCAERCIFLLVFGAWALPGRMDRGIEAAVGTPSLGVVAITAPAAIAREDGAPGLFRISREGSGGDLKVLLAVGGSARFESDYLPVGAVGFDATTATVLIHSGETNAEIKVNAADDVSAEPDEQIVLTVQDSEGYRVDSASRSATVTIPNNDFVVTTTADDGEGSLRQAILNALASAGPSVITFDTKMGPFATRQ